LIKKKIKIKKYFYCIFSFFSFGELQYALSGTPELLPFDPAMTTETKYPITSYQPKYFVAESFTDAKNKLTFFLIILEKI